jgi:shikimate dehydrogenase
MRPTCFDRGIHVKRAFVIGHPIGHSRSPLIHRYWLQTHGIDGSYEAIDVGPAGLPAFLERVRGGDFVGGNVTIPLKEQSVGLCDSLDPQAAIIGAVNTLSHSGSGLHGDNTDHFGFAANLDQQAPGWSDEGGTAVVIGAGGAARAVLLALALRGFGPIHLLNRTTARAEALAAELGPRLDRPLLAGALADFAELSATAQLVVNTSAMGMGNDSSEPLPFDRLHPGALVTDIVYAPLQTPLLKAARARGHNTVDGLGMLLHQAVPGFERWFGVRPEVTPELRAKIEATL